MCSAGSRTYLAIVGILLVATIGYPSAVHAGRMSPLSAWLSRDALGEIVDLLARHPRFTGQPVRVTSTDANGLAGAIAVVARGHLDAREDVSTIAQTGITRPGASVPSSIDDFECGAGEVPAVELHVSVSSLSGRRGRILLALSDFGDPARYWRRWEWEGTLSAAERKAMSDATATRVADGSLSFPWPETAVEEAALSLAGGIACDLRLQVRDRVDLHWSDARGMPGRLGDVSNASRHFIGNFREVGLAVNDADFKLAVRAEPLRDNIWQVWLTGEPASGDFHPVQAVTYMHVADTAAPPGGREAPVVPARQDPPVDAALQYLDVQVLDVFQSDGRSSTAELKVELKLTNRAEHPIHYAFALSGGHYLYCSPRPEFYRHDRYGYLEGELQPGQSMVRRMEVDDVQHNPNPWFGPRKCAGLKDLEGFEEFASKGHKVTEFVRWSG